MGLGIFTSTLIGCSILVAIVATLFQRRDPLARPKRPTEDVVVPTQTWLQREARPFGWGLLGASVSGLVSWLITQASAAQVAHESHQPYDWFSLPSIILVTVMVLLAFGGVILLAYASRQVDDGAQADREIHEMYKAGKGGHAGTGGIADSTSPSSTIPPVPGQAGSGAGGQASEGQP